MTTAIRLENVSKAYKLYDKPIDRLKESLNPFNKKYHHDFYALRDVGFEIEKGETVGIIGKNGSGKSTLLKIITGVLTPTTGNVLVNGKISALLELGAGFNPELTGVENVYFNGMIMGFTREEMDEKLDGILSFADIGEFINQPVKTYSSGMFVRLAFSVATNVNPDILIVDEALSVGDMFYQAKCMSRMKKMIDNGVTLLFVSHDMGSVKSLCETSIMLDKGSIISYDASDKVVEQYFAYQVQSEQKVKNEIFIETEETISSQYDLFRNNAKFLSKAFFQRIQNGKASFLNIQLLDENQKEIELVEYDQPVILRMALEVYADKIDILGFGYHIKDKNGVYIIYSDTCIEGKNLINPQKGKYIVDWKFRMPLMEGVYGILCVMSVPIDINLGKVDFCDYVPIALQFQVNRRNYSPLYGTVHWNNLVEVNKI